MFKLLSRFLMIWFAYLSIAKAEVFTFACVDCRSSMSLAPQIISRLFPDLQVRWILIQSDEYSPEQAKNLSAFPKSSRKIRRLPLSGGFSDAEILEIAQKEQVRYFLGGTDNGAALAANFNWLSGFPDNDPKHISTRLVKSLSQGASGDYAIPTHELRDIAAAKRWIANQGHSEFTLKPDVGFLGKDTSYYSKEDLLSDDSLLLSFLISGARMLIQPRIKGRVFYANTYSFEGAFKVTAASEYFQIEMAGKPAYFLNGHLDTESGLVKRMEEALTFLLPSHGIIFGPAHPEFILDEETGKLYLLEMNARPAGLGTPEFDRQVYGLSQLDLHFLALLDIERFRQEFASFPRRRQKHGFMYVVYSPTGALWNSDSLKSIQRHPSYFLPGRQYLIQGGDLVKGAESMNDLAGSLYFVNKDIRVVQAGVEQAVELFSSGRLFDVENSIDGRCVNPFRVASAYLPFQDEYRGTLSKIPWSSWVSKENF